MTLKGQNILTAESLGDTLDLLTAAEQQSKQAAQAAQTAADRARAGAASAENGATRAEAAADQGTRAVAALNASTSGAASQAQLMAQARIDATLALLAGAQNIAGAVDTSAALPGGAADGTLYTVRQTGTIWRYSTSAGAWSDTGQGSRPAAEVTATTTGVALKKSRDAAGPIHVLQGHSLMYGQDTSSAQTQAATNGAPQTRSLAPTTDVYASLLALLQPTAKMANNAFPGDQTKHSLTRWKDAPDGDVKFVWLDTNDANNYSGDPAGPATIADTQKRLAQIIRKAQQGGAQVIVMGGGPTNDMAVGAGNGLPAGPISQNVRAYAVAQFEVARRLGAARTLDVGEVLQEHPSPWIDGIHYTPAAYTEVACSMAALSGPFGTNAPRVSAGSRISPTMWAHVGGRVIQRSGAPDGAVVRLENGQVCVLPVDVTGPCELVLEVYSHTDGGPGTAEIVYGLNNIGPKPKRGIKVAEAVNDRLFVRGHSYATGPRLVQVRCTGGGLDIAGWRFVPVAEGRVETPGGAELARPRVSRLSGYPLPQTGDWVAAADHTLPISTVKGDGSAGTATVRADMTLPAAAGGGLLLISGSSTGAPYLIQSGYMVFRAGTTLRIRPWLRGDPQADATVDGVFPAGQDWQGALRLSLVGDTLDVYVNGDKKLSLAGLMYRHFVPGVIASGNGTYMAGLSVESL